jgi:uroporphyrin-III C-methyltransferase
LDFVAPAFRRAGLDAHNCPPEGGRCTNQTSLSVLKFAERIGVAIEMPGKVYLVGAGPGDPELLTRKAWRVLQSARVVLHDDLVPQEILRVLPPSAQIVNVGKRCGTKGISQPEINALMVQLAREGKSVARLKSGDPLLFGRAGEEMEALRQAGIDFEVVPGVTAALGAAASVQISLTDRRHASRVVFVTAHREGSTGLTNERHVAADTTYVIYMPGHRYAELSTELQAAGIGAEIPCVVISRATTRDETILRTTVGRLLECPAAVSPSLIVVGIVAGIAAHETVTPDGEFSSNLNEEVLQLALQHPYNEFEEDLHGRSSVE